MLRERLVPGVTTIVLLLCLSGLSVSAQKKPTPSPDQKPRKGKLESDRAFKDWPKEVYALITRPELDAYLKLQNNEEREHFIEDFWNRRDPDPDTQENEYKDEYYERLAYANEHFASGTPGSMTDRGRMYLKWGKPDSIESHPSGGSYDRSPDEGGGSTTVYPFERWFYRSLSIHGGGPGDTVRSGVEIEFVDPTGSGEYRSARGPDDKDALLMVPGAGQTLREILGIGTKSDRITGQGGFGQADYRSEKYSPFNVMDLQKDLESAPAIGGRGDVTTIGTPKIEDTDPLDFDLAVHYFRQSDSHGIAAFAIQTNNKDLAFKDSGGLQTARLNISARIITVTHKRVGSFEDSVVTTATLAELSDAKERKSIYGKAVSLAPGRYRADVIVRDVVTGATGVQHYPFTVPKYEADKLAASSIILASKLEKISDQPAAGQFIIGQTKVVPNISSVYRRGEPLGLYLQVYNAGIDQTTLRPAVDVDYVLLKGGKELWQQTEDWRGMGNTTERLILTRLIDTRALESGAYEIQIRIHDHVTGQVLVPSAKFTIK